MTKELSAEVAGVLAEHDDPPGWMWSDSDQTVYACECGDHYVAGAIDVIQEQDVLAAAEWHRNHQAAALMPLLERREQEAEARALDEMQAWVAEYAGPANGKDDAITDVLRSVWQELGYRARIIREMCADVTTEEAE